MSNHGKTKVWGLRAVVSFRGDTDGYVLECIDMQGNTIGGKDKAVFCDTDDDLIGSIRSVRDLLGESRGLGEKMRKLVGQNCDICGRELFYEGDKIVCDMCGIIEKGE